MSIELQIQSTFNQLIIDILTTMSPYKPSHKFTHLIYHGSMHNALTAHGASTHPAYNSSGYPVLNKVDVIPLTIMPEAWTTFPVCKLLDSFHDLPANLQPQAY